MDHPKAHPPPATASEADVDPLAKVRNPDGTVNWLAVGEAEQARRCGYATREQTDLLDWLHANGGSFYVARAAQRFAEHVRQAIREHGGTIATERHTWRDGRYTVTRKVQRFAAPTRRPCSRARTRSREHRPVARRASSSSRTSGSDPGSDSDGPAPARLRLAPPPRARLTYAVLSAADRGADVGRVTA